MAEEDEIPFPLLCEGDKSEGSSILIAYYDMGDIYIAFQQSVLKENSEWVVSYLADEAHANTKFSQSS
jgi:hypothetical protein